MATYRVLTEVGMLVHVEIEAATVEEAVKIAEQFKITASVKVVGEGPSGWQGDHMLVSELDPKTGKEKDNPGGDVGPEHFQRTAQGWVRDEHSIRARYRAGSDGHE